MRLIDIDALYAELQTELGSPEGSTDFLRVNRVLRRAPTIPAIPVGWLKGLMLSTEDDVDKVEYAWIMREWESEQKEQEA